MKNLLLTLLLFAAALASPAQQTTPVTTLATLNDLLARAPRANETIAVRSGYNGQDWGGTRFFTQTPSSALVTNIAHIFAVTNTYGAQGQWLSADRTNAVQDLRWWRVVADGTTDNASNIQAAMDWSRAALESSIMQFDEGVTLSSALYYASNMTVRGAGPGRSILKAASAGISLLAPQATNITYGFQLRDITLQAAGTNGATGKGLVLDTVINPRIANVEIKLFRGDTNSIGIHNINTYQSSCCGTFDSVNLNSNQRGLVIDSVNGTYSSGYHSFTGLRISQEGTGIELLRGAGNGGIYNTFLGPFIQGNGGTNDLVINDTVGNSFIGITTDAPGTGYVRLTTNSSGAYIQANGTVPVLDQQTSGSLNNIILPSSYFRVHPTNYMKFSSYNTAGTDFRIANQGTNSVTIKIGNSNGADLWALDMESGATPTLSFKANGYPQSWWTYDAFGRGNFYPFGGSGTGGGGKQILSWAAANVAPVTNPPAGNAYIWLDSNKLWLWTALGGPWVLGPVTNHAPTHYAWGTDPVPINALTNTGSIYLESANGYGFRYSNGNSIKSMLTDAGTNLYLSVLGPNDFYVNVDGTNRYRINPSGGHTWKDRNGGTLATLGSSGLSVITATNLGLRVATFDSYTPGVPQVLGNMTLADLKNVMGVNNSGTNLDNLTVTNTVRFGGNFYVTGGVGGTNKFQVTPAEVTSYTPVWLYHDFVVASGHDVYSLSTNFFNLGIKQLYPGYSDYAWLTSVGFKNATPLRGANILDSTTIDWTTTSTTNVTPSIKSQSLSTNLIDSTFYSLLMMTNSGGGGSTTTNRLVKSLYQNGSSLTIADTHLSEITIMTNTPSWCVTNFAAGYWTSDKTLHVEASGTFTAAADWSGNVVRVKLGGYVLSYTFDEPDSTTPTDAAWRIVADIQVSSPGASATVAGVGSLIYYQGIAGAMLQSGVIAAVPSGTLDTTVQNTLSVTYDNDGTQPLTFKVHSLFAEEKGAEVLTSGGVSSLAASLVAINGTTNNWNFNNTTPAAPAQTTLARAQTSTTNVSYVVDIAPTLAGISRQTWSNSTAYVLVASGTFNTTNMPYDGAMLQGVVGGTIKNNSGANTTIRPVFMVGSTTNYLSNGHLNLADSATTRAWRFDFEFYRASSTLIGGGFNHAVTAATAPTIGTGSLSATPTVTQRNALFADVACDISTNTTWAFYLSVDVANTTNIVSVTYGGLK